VEGIGALEDNPDGGRAAALLPVLVLDPDVLARRALTALVVAHGFDLAAAVGDAAAAIAVLRERRIGMLVTDIALPDMPLSALVTSVRRRRPGPLIAVVTGEDDGDVLAQVMRTGVDAILSKYAPPALLMLRLTAAVAGGLVLDENTAPPVVSWMRNRDDGGIVLPARERQVLELILQGHNARSAAHELGLAESTVKNHAAKAAARLGMRTSKEAAQEAGRRGLVAARGGRTQL